MMARTLAGYGIDSARVFEQAGLPASPGDGDQRVVSVAMQRVWRQAVVETGDEAFGLTYAQNVHPAALHGLGFAWAASNTLRDAFNRLVRYYRLIASAGEIALTDTTDHVRLAYLIPGEKGAAAPSSLDAALAMFVQLCRITRDPAFSPARVDLQRVAPKDTKPFDAFFRCPIHYDADENALFFDHSELDQPLPMANPELARANDQVIIDYLNRQGDSDIVNKVRAGIIDSLPSGPPSQERIASLLNMSGRTLQRRLTDQAQSFSGLLESIRSELAQQYLSTPGRSISEVAYLLGFSEPGNFGRSFKRWTGMTPAQFQSQDR